MHLARLRLLQFKNYAASELRLAPQLNAFVGQNGMGKTNLLDAIYYCCMGKSYFGLRDTHLVQHGAAFFRLEADFFKHNDR
ncbi:MAG: AAA family ATPase, partial [Bacteroidota bacterium]